MYTKERGSNDGLNVPDTLSLSKSVGLSRKSYLFLVKY